MKRSRSASAVACDAARAGPVLPTTRSPSTKQTRIRAALAGSTPAARGLCAREGAGEPGLHRLEKPADATFDVPVVASQFHRGGHQQASAPAAGTAGALDVTRKEGPQAINRCVARTEFDIYPRQGVGDVAIERTQEQRVLAPESRIEAAARKPGRGKQVRKRRAMIAA